MLDCFVPNVWDCKHWPWGRGEGAVCGAARPPLPSPRRSGADRRMVRLIEEEAAAASGRVALTVGAQWLRQTSRRSGNRLLQKAVNQSQTAGFYFHIDKFGQSSRGREFPFIFLTTCWPGRCFQRSDRRVFAHFLSILFSFVVLQIGKISDLNRLVRKSAAGLCFLIQFLRVWRGFLQFFLQNAECQHLL